MDDEEFQSIMLDCDKYVEFLHGLKSSCSGTFMEYFENPENFSDQVDGVLKAAYFYIDLAEAVVQGERTCSNLERMREFMNKIQKYDNVSKIKEVKEKIEEEKDFFENIMKSVPDTEFHKEIPRILNASGDPMAVKICQEYLEAVSKFAVS